MGMFWRKNNMVNDKMEPFHTVDMNQGSTKTKIKRTCFVFSEHLKYEYSLNITK